MDPNKALPSAPPPPATMLKELIREAARLHEESWDANGRKYSRSHFESAEIAAVGMGQEALTAPVYLLLLLAWNDALDWARGH